MGPGEHSETDDMDLESEASTTSDNNTTVYSSSSTDTPDKHRESKKRSSRKRPRREPGTNMPNKLMSLINSQSEKTKPAATVAIPAISGPSQTMTTTPAVTAPPKPNTDDQTEDIGQKVRVPPITLSDPSQWPAIYGELEKRHINYTKVRSTKQGLKIDPCTPDDYRNLVKLLDSGKHSYFTYALPDDKPLKAILRGIPSSISDNLILNDLKNNKNLPVIAVTRMKQGPDRRPMPLVVVQLDRQENAQNIFKVTEVLRIIVTVESPRPNNGPTQCHRCQGFGHTQRACMLPVNCVKCAGRHFTAECLKKDRLEPAKCCNCGGSHPANYSNCPKRPKPQKRVEQPIETLPSNPPVSNFPAAFPVLKKQVPAAADIPRAPGLPFTQPGPSKPQPPKPLPRKPKPVSNSKPTYAETTAAPKQQKPTQPPAKIQANKIKTIKPVEPEMESENNFTLNNVSGLISIVFKIGTSLHKATTVEEVEKIVLGFTQEICQLFNVRYV